VKLTEINNEIQQFSGKARSVKELLASIKDGRFTLDGRKLIVRGDLSLTRLRLTSLLGCPQRVYGDFDCSYNKLRTLEGAPQEVKGSFSCRNNMLTTLAGVPRHVGDYFDCSINLLKTLEGGPFKVGGSYDCSFNKLSVLNGMPRVIKGDVFCHNNQLTSFEGCARTIKGSLYGHHNKLLTSLEGGPNFVGRNVKLTNCQKLTSLYNIYLHFPEVRGSFDFTDTDVKKHILGLLRVRKLQGVVLNNKKLEAILNKHLNGGNLLACALELVEAGYEEQAKL